MREPSGDHAGAESGAAPSVITCSPLPSEFMTWIASNETYASCAPSGDQAGSTPKPGEMRCRFDPSVPIVQTAHEPFKRVLANASRVPSGDHAGVAVDAPAPPSWVNWTAFPPSASISHPSNPPPRSLTNASRVPSGDQAGD